MLKIIKLYIVRIKMLLTICKKITKKHSFNKNIVLKDKYFKMFFLVINIFAKVLFWIKTKYLIEIISWSKNTKDSRNYVKLQKII